jgi:phosphoenolpyruvate phosphomutase
VDADVTRKSRPQDFVKCTKPYTNDFYNKNIYLDQVLQENAFEMASGEWSGLLAVESGSLPVFKETLEQLAQKDGFESLSVPDLLDALLSKTRISVMYTRGGWIDIDDIADYREAGRF